MGLALLLAGLPLLFHLLLQCLSEGVSAVPVNLRFLCDLPFNEAVPEPRVLFVGEQSLLPMLFLFLHKV